MSCGIYGLKQCDGQRRDVEKPRQAKRCVRRFIFGGECVVVGVRCKTRIEPSVGTESRPKKACGGVKKLWPEGLWGWMCVFVCQQPITSHGFFSVSLSRGPRLLRTFKPFKKRLRRRRHHPKTNKQQQQQKTFVHFNFILCRCRRLCFSVIRARRVCVWVLSGFLLSERSETKTTSDVCVCVLGCRADDVDDDDGTYFERLNHYIRRIIAFHSIVFGMCPSALLIASHLHIVLLQWVCACELLVSGEQSPAFFFFQFFFWRAKVSVPWP